MKDYAIRQRERDLAKFRANKMSLCSCFRELAVCAHFGCGKHLTPMETLYGGMCANHSVKVVTDIMKVLKFE